MIHEKKILVNDKSVRLNTMINKGSILSLKILEDEDYGCSVSDKLCSIVYEDDLVLVVNKPAGIIIHDDGNSNQDTLDNQVAAWYSQNNRKIAVRHIHRLDKETSGCVLYSKCSFFQPYLDQMLKEKKIYRQYAAVCDGLIQWDRKVIDLPIGKDRHHNQRQRISKSGKSAVTEVNVLKRNKLKNTTLVSCVLKTGRTHQIRVHMQAVKHPLLSDELYGKRNKMISRCALHAEKITWIDPVSMETKQAVCTVPEEISNCI